MWNIPTAPVNTNFEAIAFIGPFCTSVTATATGYEKYISSDAYTSFVLWAIELQI